MALAFGILWTVIGYLKYSSPAIVHLLELADGEFQAVK